MTKYAFQVVTWTPTSQIDQVLTGPYQALTGANATQLLRVNEIRCVGQAAASAVNGMSFARSSVVAITPTALAVPNSNGPIHGSAAALTAPPIGHVAAATAPNRSPIVTLARLQLSFNAFGGAAQWNADHEGDEWTIVGNAANIGESVLSAQLVTGTPGLMGSQIIYEPV